MADCAHGRLVPVDADRSRCYHCGKYYDCLTPWTPTRAEAKE